MKIRYKKILPLALCLSLVACGEQSFDEHLSAAQNYLTERNYDAAEVELKNAIRQSPEHAQARFLLGEIYFNRGQFSAAEKEFNKSYELNNKDEQFFQYLVKSYFFNSNLASIDKLNSEVDSDYVRYYAALTDIQNDSIELANEKFTHLAKSADKTVAALANTYLLIDDNEFEQAISLVTDILADNPDNLEALQIKAKLGNLPKKLQLSVDAYSRLVALYPKHYQFTLYYANALIADKQFLSAKPYVTLLAKVNPNSSFVNMLQGQIKFHEADFSGAKMHMEKAIQGGIDVLTNRILAGVSNYNLDKFEQAYQHLNNIKNRLPPEHIAKKILIDVQLKLGYSEEALKSIRELEVAGQANSNLLLSVSDYMLKAGQTAEAKALLENSLDLENLTATELSQKGVIQLKLNQHEQAIATLEGALVLEPDSVQIKQALAFSYLANKESDLALKIAQEIQQSADDKEKVAGLLIESAIEHELGQYKNANALLEKVLNIDSDNLAALYRFALYAHKALNNAQAYDYYIRALTVNPNHLGSVRNFIRLSETYDEKRTNIEQWFVDNAKTNKSSSANESLALYYFINNQYEKALIPLNQLKVNGTANADINLMLGNVLFQMQRWSDALAEYEIFANKTPKDLVVTKKMFAAAELAGEFEKGFALAENKLSIFKGNAGLVVYKVYFQALLKKDIAQQDLSALKRDPAINTTWFYFKALGLHYFNQANFYEAKAHFMKAYTIQRNYTNAVNFAKAAKAEKDYNAAINILIKEHKIEPSLILQTALADTYMASNQFDLAIKEYKAIITVSPTNIIALNNLALASLKAGFNESALSYAENAFELVPSSPAIMDTYAQALAANNLITKSLHYFDQALSLLPNNNDLILNKAHTMALAGSNEEVKALIEHLPNLSAEQTLKRQALLDRL